jgi:hypothetical protein
MQTSNDASSQDVVGSDVQDAQKEAGPPQSCSVDAGACVAGLPSGWDLVAFDPSNENACPSNYTSAPVVWNVVPTGAACDCGCTVTNPPACDVGTLQRYVSSDTSCGTTGVSLAVNGPGCTAYPSTTLLSHSKSSPLAPTGGTCTGDIIKSPTNVGRNAGAICRVPAACEEQFCGGDVPGGFQSCIQSQASGAQTCPSGWLNPVVVGDDFTFDCSACTCDVNGSSTCTNASVDIFSDSQCNTKLVTMPVDGNCDVDTAAGQSPGAFEYHATLNQVCKATGAKTPSNVQLVNSRTICCK